MENLTVEDIVRESKGRLILGNKKNVCRTFSKDTRQIKKGDIYIGIKGKKFDGNKFWREALEKGAVGVIIDKNNCTDDDKRKFENKIIIEVEDTLSGQTFHKETKYYAFKYFLFPDADDNLKVVIEVEDPESNASYTGPKDANDFVNNELVWYLT